MNAKAMLFSLPVLPFFAVAAIFCLLLVLRPFLSFFRPFYSISAYYFTRTHDFCFKTLEVGIFQTLKFEAETWTSIGKCVESDIFGTWTQNSDKDLNG